MSKYLALIRFDKPIGNFLLLWPTLTALWIASDGVPTFKNLFIFIMGVFIMRAAGCILNDLADRKLDIHVTRTKQRPLTAGKVSIKQALSICFILLLFAGCLVIQLNRLSLIIAFFALLLTILYPFAKRFTSLPQVILGITWNSAVLMAFAAVTNKISFLAWFLYLIAILWTLVFDTIYGMADRVDDLKIGIKSTAILFGKYDRFILSILQTIVIVLLITLGQLLHANIFFYMSLIFTAILFLYQQYLIRERDEQKCIQAFLNNNWAWLGVFLGVFLNYTLRT